MSCRERPRVKDPDLWQREELLLREWFTDRWVEVRVKVKPAKFHTLEIFQEKGFKDKSTWIIGEKKPNVKMEVLQVIVKLCHGILYLLREVAPMLLDPMNRDI